MYRKTLRPVAILLLISGCGSSGPGHENGMPAEDGTLTVMGADAGLRSGVFDPDNVNARVVLGNILEIDWTNADGDGVNISIDQGTGELGNVFYGFGGGGSVYSYVRPCPNVSCADLVVDLTERTATFNSLTLEDFTFDATGPVSLQGTLTW